MGIRCVNSSKRNWQSDLSYLEFRATPCMGYRLVYEVIDERVVISVVAVGKRERSTVYERAKKRS